MPKWKKDETEFTVSVNYTDVRGYQATIPKPIMEEIGTPKKLKFSIKGKRKIELESGDQ